MSGYNQKGFTLLEILISILLLSIITLGVVNVTQDSMNTMDRTNEFNSNNLRIETAFSRFEWDLTQIYSPLYFSTVMNPNQNLTAGANQNNNSNQTNDGTPANPQPPQQINPALQAYYQQMLSRFERNERFITLSKEGIPIPRIYSPEKNILEFFTSSNRRKVENTPQSHFGWVQYGLMDQEMRDDTKVHPEMPSSVKSFVRFFDAVDPYNPERSINIRNGSDAAKVKGAVLLENVEVLEFQFWDYKKKKWETNLRVIEDGEKIIRGVKILITWWDSEGKKSTERVFRPHWPAVAPVDAPQNAPGQGNTIGRNTNQGNTDADGDGESDEEEQ